jgi:FtsZ-interacting cell division protein ZipA
MSSTMTIVVAIVVVLAVVAVAAFLVMSMRNRRSQQLRDRFGPEYDRAVEETGDRKEAERLLHERVERRQELPIQDLEPAAREGYAQEWRGVQSRFVDDPKGAVAGADELMTRLMRDRGYPAESFEQQAADASVDHAGAVTGYRRARVVLVSARGQAATDDLRQAMVHYRDLFEQLLGEPAMATERPPREEPVTREEPATEVQPGTRREVT